MNYSGVKNVAWANSDQTALDCTVTFENVGTVPFTASPHDDTLHGRDIFQRALDGEFGPIDDYAPSPIRALGKVDFKKVVDSHIEATARSRDYASGVSLASYVSSTKPEWAAEAQAFVAWRDDVWAFVFAELAKVESGQTAPPETTDVLIALLPQIAWPEAS